MFKNGKPIFNEGNIGNYELQIQNAAEKAGIDVGIHGNKLFGLIDLSATPSEQIFSWMLLIPLLAGVTSYLVSWLSQKLNAATQDPQMQNGCSGKTMTYMMPLMSLYFCFIMPCSLGLYWIVGNVLSLGQSLLLHKMYDPQKVLDEVQAKIDKEKEVKKAKRSAAAEKKAAALAAGKKKNK
jgi:YidC/Oxa1 family membrane protein insertase